MANILSEILKKPRGVLLGILGGGVPPGSPYPDPGFSVAFGKYRMQWFSSRTCTVRAAGANIECRRYELLAVSGGVPPPPREFVKLDTLKCNFLRSLDRNWVTGIMRGIISFFSIVCIT